MQLHLLRKLPWQHYLKPLLMGSHGATDFSFEKMLKVKLCTPKFIFCSPILHTLEYDFFEKGVFTEIIKLKWGKIAHNPIWLVPLEEEIRTHIHTYRGKTLWGHREETISISQREASAGKTLSTRSWTSSLPNYEKINFWFWSCPVCRVWLREP